MGLIKEPLGIDFEVENRPLTKEEEKLISNFIKAEKKNAPKASKNSIKNKNYKNRKT